MANPNPYDELKEAKAAMERLMQRFVAAANTVRAEEIDAMAMRVRRAIVFAAQAAAIELRDSNGLDPREWDTYQSHMVDRAALARLFEILNVPYRGESDPEPSAEAEARGYAAIAGAVGDELDADPLAGDPEVAAMVNAYLEG